MHISLPSRLNLLKHIARVQPPVVPTTIRSKPELKVLAIGCSELVAKFRNPNYTEPSRAQITRSLDFFNNSTRALDWTVASYNDIPDVRDEQHRATGSTQKIKIPPHLLRPLPEVLLLGHTNAGKSSLVNTLLLEGRNARAIEHAYVSKRAGYTKTLNCFNIGNRLRIVDSPGYGERGQLSQGQAVIDYVSERKVLRRAFVLIDGVAGFRDQDFVIVDHLVEAGVPFEIIFTKVDDVVRRHFLKVKPGAPKDVMSQHNENVKRHFAYMIEASGLDQLVTDPRIFFTNSSTNRWVPRRLGYDMVRQAIHEACLLDKAPID